MAATEESLLAYKDLAIILYNLGAFLFDNNVNKIRAKAMFERVYDLGRINGGGYLQGLDQQAKNVLDRFF